MSQNEQDRIRNLEEENRQLKKENARLEKEKESIEKKKESIEKKFEDTKKEFEEFKAKHAGTVQNLRKALKIKPDLPQSRNPIGAKPRHTGHGRKKPTHIDREEPLNLDVCPHCNKRLKGKNG